MMDKPPKSLYTERYYGKVIPPYINPELTQLICADCGDEITVGHAIFCLKDRMFGDPLMYREEDGTYSHNLMFFCEECLNVRISNHRQIVPDDVLTVMKCEVYISRSDDEAL